MDALQVIHSFEKIKKIRSTIKRTKLVWSSKIDKLLHSGLAFGNWRGKSTRILYMKKYKKQMKYIPVYTDSRKFKIVLYVGIFTPACMCVKITESNVLIENESILYEGIDGISTDEYFNMSLEMKLPEIVKYEEVKKLRNTLTKKQQARDYTIYLNSECKLVRGPCRLKRFNKKL